MYCMRSKTADPSDQCGQVDESLAPDYHLMYIKGQAGKQVQYDIPSDMMAIRYKQKIASTESCLKACNMVVQD
jgi:hypothetical protein